MSIINHLIPTTHSERAFYLFYRSIPFQTNDPIQLSLQHTRKKYRRAKQKMRDKFCANIQTTPICVSINKFWRFSFCLVIWLKTSPIVFCVNVSFSHTMSERGEKIKPTLPVPHYRIAYSFVAWTIAMAKYYEF